jgi:hypothetical protein
MNEKCYNHPDNDVIGSCKNCERHLCSACLSSGVCRDSDDCLEYQNNLTDSGSPPVIRAGYHAFHRYFRRLLEVQAELAEIGYGFVSESNVDPPINIYSLVKSTHINGLRAYHLTQEGFTLLELLRITIEFLKTQIWFNSENFKKVKSAEFRLNHFARPLFTKTLEVVSCYKNLNLKDLFQGDETKTD